VDEEPDEELEELDELLLSDELELDDDELDDDELDEEELEDELDEDELAEPQQAPKLSTSHHWLSKKYFAYRHVPLGT
jgi:hypothetical protein